MSIMQTYLETLEQTFRGMDGKQEGQFDAANTKHAIAEGEHLLSEMKIQIHSVKDKNQRDIYQAKMNEYKALIGRLHKKILIGGESSKKRPEMTPDQRAQHGLDLLNQSNQQLTDAQALGLDTLNQLRRQREVIKHAQKNTEELNQELSYSNRLLKKMS